MLYLIRDYGSLKDSQETVCSFSRKRQWEAVKQAERMLAADYEKRLESYGALEPLQAFFDYAYFSCMFMQKGRDMAASKRGWNLYRCRFAYLVADILGLVAEEEGLQC